MKLRRLAKILLFLAVAGVLLPVSLFLGIGCRALFPKEVTTRDRLAAFPRENLPLDSEVTIYWNEHLVPFVDAETDRDLAFTLGLVHGFLREGQLEVLRKISQGRIAEMAGPAAAGIDEALRRLDYGKASEETFRSMPPETREWLTAYAEGINLAIARAPQAPPISGLLALDREPFTPEDLLTFGRLAGTDVNWLTLFVLLSERDSPRFDEILRHVNETSAESTPSFGRTDPSPGASATDPSTTEPEGSDSPAGRVAAELVAFLNSLARTGSNTVAVGPSRSESGHALLANDPHLGQNLPNFWTIVGARSPGYHSVGFMIPGLPFFAIGRNPHIAWGGTNMRSASSDLVDATNLPVTGSHRETIGIRFWPDREITVRETEAGPILSDAEIFPSKEGESIALRWTGHRPSDEITAFLRANRATSVPEFLDSFSGYSVSGQNMIAVDAEGNIGMVLAVELPLRGYDALRTVVQDPESPEGRWTGFAGPAELPTVLNPPDGVLASANNRPVVHNPPIGYLFNEDERIDRLLELLASRRLWNVESLMELQRDVHSPASRDLARFLTDWNDVQAESPVAMAVAAWDGRYETDSSGAAAFELWLSALVDEFPGGKFTDGYFRDWRYLAKSFAADLANLTPSEKETLIRESLADAEEGFAEYPVWGDLHRLKVGHLLGGLPVVGGLFVYDRFPAPGSRETIYKTAHGIIDGPHESRYGSQSRHISSMEDPDDNWFVLFGGQDGWLGSENFADQVPLWREGRYLRIPLRIETVREEFERRMTLRP